jgi:hypothetical protein
VREGIARGTSSFNGVLLTGAPADDGSSATLKRSPSVQYEVVDPAGHHYQNSNPSGNLEWEQFKISTDSFDSTQMDYHADSLPAGVYHIHMSGMDMTNLNAWRFFNDAQGVSGNEAMGVSSSGVPVPPLRPHAISGTLYYDLNANGTLDASEPVMSDATLRLAVDANSDGTADRNYTTVTDSSGRYSFPNLTVGTCTLRVDSSSVVETVAAGDYDGASTANVATFVLQSGHSDPAVNFSYQRAHPHEISGALYYDLDSSGTRNAGEPAMANVRVSLAVDANSDGSVDSTLTTTTDTSGVYRFANLYAGIYRLTIDSTTLPGDALAASAGASGSPYVMNLDVRAGHSDSSFSFLFRRVTSHTVAGTLFYDLNGNGTRESGETAMAGRTVSLAIDGNSDGTVDSTLTTTTDSSGAYRFTWI